MFISDIKMPTSIIDWGGQSLSCGEEEVAAEALGE